MTWYRRKRIPGGTYFFTAVTEGRKRILTSDLARPLLRTAISEALGRWPANVRAMVLLPDHFHTMWRLPVGDWDYSTRWADLKSGFTRSWLAAGGDECSRSQSRLRHRRRGVWQRKFWEHVIHQTDEGQDFANHLNYIHYNPVKHGLVSCPHLWPWSTFDRWVGYGWYPEDWMCVCGGKEVQPPDFSWADEMGLELE